MHPPGYGRLLDPQHLAGIGMAQILGENQQRRHLEVGFQPVDRLIEPFETPVAIGPVGVAFGIHLDKGGFDPAEALLPPQKIPAVIESNLIGPGRKPAPAAKAHDLPCQGYRHLLRGVLGLSPVTQEAVGDPVKHGVMPFQQLLERGAVAVLRQADEIEVVRTHVSGCLTQAGGKSLDGA